METTANAGCGGYRHLITIKVGEPETVLSDEEESMGYQLVGRVKAYQG